MREILRRAQNDTLRVALTICEQVFYCNLSLAALAWPAKPSASPSVPAAWALATAPFEPSTVRKVVTVFKKTRTLKPPVKRALPEVGSVWFKPAA